MPPLRDRREEIPLLVRHFLTKYSAHYNRPETEISPATLEAFMQYDWPGNVRELENVDPAHRSFSDPTPRLDPVMPRRRPPVGGRSNGGRTASVEPSAGSTRPAAAAAPAAAPRGSRLRRPSPRRRGRRRRPKGPRSSSSAETPRAPPSAS